MITLLNVHKSFGTKHVLRGVDLTIRQGTSMVVIGGSGTGKSVLLKSVLGLVTPARLRQSPKSSSLTSRRRASTQ